LPTWSASSRTCAQGRAPKQVQTPEFAAVANYGYHLDAGKFGVFLRKHCLEKLGVQYVPDHVVGVNRTTTAISPRCRRKQHGALEGDLFIDCTGMQSLLLGQHYGIPLIPQQHVLYNDSALAVQIPYPADEHPIASQTSSTAQSAGWIWDIGLPTRRGIGHVYASGYISDDQAEAELRAYIVQTGGPQTSRAAQAELPARLPRKILAPQLRGHRPVGRLHRTAGSVGAGHRGNVGRHGQRRPAGHPRSHGHRRQALQRCLPYRWERVIDFLKLHYVLSQRRDTPYWRDNTDPAKAPERLAELLTLWQHQRRRAAISTASRKCSRRPATSTSCTAWASAATSAARPSRRKPAWPTATSRSGQPYPQNAGRAA
jgi:hypothetical protein